MIGPTGPDAATSTRAFVGTSVLTSASRSAIFRPPYVGGRGWLGVYLDVEPDWDEVAGIVDEAFRHVAPRTVLKQLDARR